MPTNPNPIIAALNEQPRSHTHVSRKARNSLTRTLPSDFKQGIRRKRDAERLFIANQYRAMRGLKPR